MDIDRMMLVSSALAASLLLSLANVNASPAPSSDPSARDPARAGDQAADPDPARDYALDFIDEFTRAKLRKNGEFLFCDQAGYRDCLKVSRQQCLDELSRLKANCLARTDQKFPDRMTSEADIDRYVSYYSVCMLLQHSASKDARDIGVCLRNVEWDKAQRDRSLLK